MSLRANKNVGLIGLGIIGERIAEHLRKSGYPVIVWSRTPRPVPNFVSSPAEVAQLCERIQLFVPDDAALMATVQALAPSLTRQHIVLAHCTVAPETMRAAAKVVTETGAGFLDAPFTGSKLAAEKGELVYYIGGNEEPLEKARPLLEASSKEIVKMGAVGDATTIKIATNLVTAATVQVAVEAMALVQSAGIPREKFALAMKSNASSSGTLALKLPKILENDFEPHFSVKHMLKDMQIAARLARAADLELRLTEAARDELLDQMTKGRGDLDYSAVAFKYFAEPGSETALTPPAKAAPALKELRVEPVAAKASPKSVREQPPELVLPTMQGPPIPGNIFSGMETAAAPAASEVTAKPPEIVQIMPQKSVPQILEEPKPVAETVLAAARRKRGLFARFRGRPQED